MKLTLACATVVMVVAIVVLSSDTLLLMTLGAPSPRVPGPVEPPPRMSIQPPEVDLGLWTPCEVPRILSTRAELVNDGETLLRVIHWSATCGCTSSDLPPSFDIAPGERRAFTATIEPWVSWGGKTQTIQFIVEEEGKSARPGPPLELKFEVGGSMHPAPGLVRRVTGEETDCGRMILVSEDNEPFSILASDPPCIASEEAAPSFQQTLSWDWTAIDAYAAQHCSDPDMAEDSDSGHLPNFSFDADGYWTRIVARITTDRADCPIVFLVLENLDRSIP